MGEIHERMAKVLASLSFIPKERSQGVSYEFRSIDALMNVLHGKLAEHELFASPRVLDDWQVNMIAGSNNRQQGQALFRVCVDIYASDGSWVTLGPGMAQSHDYGDKAVYQAQQNAIKYLLLEAFCIPTAEQDMDGRTPDAPEQSTPSVTATAEQRNEFQTVLDGLNSTDKKNLNDWLERNYQVDLDGFANLSQSWAEAALSHLRKPKEAAPA